MMNADAHADGGPVEGTGGGSKGAARRWARPKKGVPLFRAGLLIDGVGRCTARRRSMCLDLVVGEVSPGAWAWRASTDCPQGAADGREGSLASAQAAALAAGRRLVEAAERMPRETADHPAVGPARWQ
mgnify:CR=1 FL=1